MFEPLLAPLTWGYATRKPELGRISSAGRLAARSAPEVMRLCSNCEYWVCGRSVTRITHLID